MHPMDKLIGRSNYNSQKFAMQTCSEHEDLFGCIVAEKAYTKHSRKITRAKGKIILSVDQINYLHIQNCKTAKEAQDSLQVGILLLSGLSNEYRPNKMGLESAN